MVARDIKVVLALLAVAAMVPVAGCGGGSDSSNGEAFAQTTMPLAKYGHKTDFICSEGSFEQEQLAAAYLAKHPNTKEVDLVIPAAVPPIEKEIKELHEIGLPLGHEKEAEVFVEEMEVALQILKKEPSGAVSRKDNPFNKANELGHEAAEAVRELADSATRTTTH